MSDLASRVSAFLGALLGFLVIRTGSLLEVPSTRTR